MAELNIGKLSAEVRSSKGKEAAHKLRASGKIPGIVYGGKDGAIELTLDPKALQKSLDPTKRRNTVITLDVAGKGEMTVMLKDYQVHPIKHVLTHADFVRIDATKEVEIEVPLIVTGKSPGVKDGGILHQTVRMFMVVCTPKNIPNKLEIDISTLGMGEALHVSDLKLPENVKSKLDAGETLVTVVAPRAERVTEEQAAAAAEAEAAAAAAAPAAGGKDAKGGAAPAAAGAKDAKGGAAPAAGAKPAAEKGAKK